MFFSWLGRRGLGDGGAPPSLLGRVGKTGCDLFAMQIQTWGIYGSWFKVNSMGSLPSLLALQGAAGRLGRQT